MPTVLQYPLERCQELQHQWDRLLQERPRLDGSVKLTVAISTLPPQDPDDNDDEDEQEEDEAEEDLEPAVIRELDKDE